MAEEVSSTQSPKRGPWLARTGAALIQASENGGCRPLMVRLFRSLTLGFGLLYALGLVMVILGSQYIGEQNVTTAFLIFLPPLVWLLPAPPLMLAALLFHRSTLGVIMAVLAWFCFGHLGWRLGPGGNMNENTSRSIRVMTFNRGQHGNNSLQPFKNAIRPDILVMQEAGGRAAGYARAAGYEEFTHATNLGEHTLLSRFPVLEQTRLPALPGKSPKAVRFVLDWNGRQIALYSVHMQTPRDPLRYQVRGSFLYGILGFPGSPFEERRKQLQTFWDGQIADAELILKAVREDPLPAIVVGDFNSPHVGYVHRILTKELGDSQAESGTGLGLTVPGTTHNPLSGGGPWMRIDYIFHTRHWQAEACVTEDSMASQHRPVAARLVLEAP